MMECDANVRDVSFKKLYKVIKETIDYDFEPAYWFIVSVKNKDNWNIENLKLFLCVLNFMRD